MKSLILILSMLPLAFMWFTAQEGKRPFGYYIITFDEFLKVG